MSCASFSVDLSLLDKTIEHLNRFEDNDDANYDCREKYSDFYLENADGEKAPFRCGSWNCYCCAHRMRYNLIREVRRLGQEKNLRRFLTLTLDPKKIPSDMDSFEYIQELWNKFRIYLEREFGQTDFVLVREKQENGRAHLHVLLSRFVPYSWINQTWQKMGGGSHVRIEYADAQRVGNYLSKYLADNTLMKLPKGVNRYSYSSGSIDLAVRYRKQTTDNTWRLLVEVEQEFPSGYKKVSREVKPIDFVDPP